MNSVLRVVGLFWLPALLAAAAVWANSQGLVDVVAELGKPEQLTPIAGALAIYWLAYALAWHKAAAPGRAPVMATAITLGLLAALQIIYLAFVFAGFV